MVVVAQGLGSLLVGPACAKVWRAQGDSAIGPSMTTPKVQAEAQTQLAEAGAQQPLGWQTQRAEVLARTRVFTARAVHKRRSDGKLATFAVLDCPDWVNVVALTTSGELILIRQFRQGTDSVTLEIPGGMVDPGETPQQAAVRELLEETGYACSHCEPIGVVEPNPALQSNRCFTFLATGCVWTGDPSFDPTDGTEECILALVPATEAGSLVQSGQITHALVVAAFAHAWLARALPMP